MDLSVSSVAQSCPTVCDPMDCSPLGFSVHGDSPGKNIGVGCHFLLQLYRIQVGLPSVAQLVKNLPAMQETPVQFLGQQDLLEFSHVMPIESVMLSNHLILCHPFSFCLQSFPVSGSFPMSWLFTPGGQSIGASASASVLPMNIQC